MYAQCNKSHINMAIVRWNKSSLKQQKNLYLAPPQPLLTDAARDNLDSQFHLSPMFYSINHGVNGGQTNFVTDIVVTDIVWLLIVYTHEGTAVIAIRAYTSINHFRTCPFLSSSSE